MKKKKKTLPSKKVGESEPVGGFRQTTKTRVHGKGSGLLQTTEGRKKEGEVNIHKIGGKNTGRFDIRHQTSAER